MIKLRDYQERSVTEVRGALANGKKKILLTLPTGSGKTFIASSILSGLKPGKSGLVLAPRRELVYQFHRSLFQMDTHAGIIMAGEPTNVMSRIQVATLPTLHSRSFQRDVMRLPRADVVIADEAHLYEGKTGNDILNAYPDAITIGLTATPCRGDGRSLGDHWEELIIGTTPRELMDKGHLVEPRYYAPTEPDLKGVATRMGDYVLKGLSERMNVPSLIGDIYSNWKRIAPGRRTVIFCVDRKHGRAVAEEFLCKGEQVEYLDGNTEIDERKGILERFSSGQTQVLVNVFVAAYGWDCPPADCCVLARPTKSIVLYLQCVGRVLRTFRGKEDAIVIDHSGCVNRHGFVDEPRPWELGGDTTVNERREKDKEDKKEEKEITCEECRTVFKGLRQCPECGHIMIPKSKPIPTHNADLKEVDRDGSVKTATMQEKAEWYGQIKHYAASKGYNPGWAAHKYKMRYKVWPNHPMIKNAAKRPPGPHVSAWIKNEMARAAIAARKRMEKNG